MLAHSHATSGALAWSIAAPTVAPIVLDQQLSGPEILIGLLLCAGASLLPDLDHPDGTIANCLGPISEVLTRFVNWISGGHRHATHSLFFVGLLGVGTWALQRSLGHYFVLGLVFVLLALASRALHLSPPGDGIGSWGVVVIEALVGTWIVDRWMPATPQWLPYVVAVGCMVHVLGDCLTDRGCPLLWPVPVRWKLPLISCTGNRVETWLLTPLMVLGTLAALWFLVMPPTPAQEEPPAEANTSRTSIEG